MTATIPPPSALTSFISARSPPPPPSTYSPHHYNLALQILHNLQHQHSWTSLRVHTRSPLAGASLPRPLISGVPPKRIYVHPDQQIEELQAGINDEVKVEREWVLPTHLQEKWSLRRFAEVFDAVPDEPPEDGNDGLLIAREIRGKRRGGKRVLLATLGGDSTIVYYIVHDGIVKPRQN